MLQILENVNLNNVEALDLKKFVGKVNVLKGTFTGKSECYFCKWK